MRTLMLLLGSYQLLLFVCTVLFQVWALFTLMRASPDSIHWGPLIIMELVLVSSMLFCLLNGLRLVARSQTILDKIKGLMPLSIISTILTTALIAVLIADTVQHGNLLTSQAKQEYLNQEAPEFQGNDLNGSLIRLSDFRGKYVFLDFWATWCGICVQELPYVIKASENFSREELIVIGINCDRDVEALEAYVQKNNLPFPQVFDQNGEIKKLYKVSGIPRNFLIDPHGKIIAGDLRGRNLHRKLVSVVKKQSL